MKKYIFERDKAIADDIKKDNEYVEWSDGGREFNSPKNKSFEVLFFSFLDILHFI